MQSIATALAWHAISFGDLLDRTHRHAFFDNAGTQYTGALPEALLETINRDVGRFSATPAGLEYLNHYYKPSGDLRVPMLICRRPEILLCQASTKSNTETWPAEPVGRTCWWSGKSVAMAICALTLADLSAAFTDLVKWVELGIKPTL